MTLVHSSKLQSKSDPYSHFSLFPHLLIAPFVTIQSSLDELKKLVSQNSYPRGVVKYNMNDVLQRQQNKSLTPTITVPKKTIFLVLPCLGLQSKIVSIQTNRV